MEKLKDIQIVFESVNQFRMLAPYNVARGVIELMDDSNLPEIKQKALIASVMDVVHNNVPPLKKETIVNGKKATVEAPAYKAHFTDNMIKEIESYIKELASSKAHEKRMSIAKEKLINFKPTLSLGEALYRLSFYLISNHNNLAKSTNNLIAFAKKLFLEQSNNMLVDSAIMRGGQGKSTVQKGLFEAAREMGLSSSMCHLPSLTGGVQEAFVQNEICIDDETTFRQIDFDSLNKILDKSVVTIKGKYIKEWNAPSIANVLVGTNFLPTDINTRRYSIRMVDENFQLDANFGRWTIPGKIGDRFGDSYQQVIDWVKEGWLNLFYYCNKYDLKPTEYEETGFDYGLQYRIKSTLNQMGNTVATIPELVKYFEQVEGEKIEYKTKQLLKNQLYILANQLNLTKIEKHKNIFSKYDWAKAMEIDESDLQDRDNLEIVYCFFHNERFNIPGELQSA